MKYKIMTLMLAILLVVNLTSAVQYHQQRILQNDSVTTRIHSFVFRDISGISENHIKANNPLELYVQYDVYIKSWNEKNPNYKVDNCNVLVRYNSNLENETQVLLNETYTENDTDIFRDKYFVTLETRESILVDIDCEFETNRSIDTPADFTIVTPTWECQACQMYEWTLTERDIIKAEVIGDNTVEVIDYIKELITINFEIIISLFWIVLILTALVPMSLVFVGIYWLFLYLRRIVQ
jgi:hypothetical protein